MLRSTCRRFACGAVAVLAFCAPGFADLLLDNVESGKNGPNALGGYWYTFNDRGILTNHAEELAPISAGARGSYSVGMVFSGLSGGTAATVGLGTGISKSDTEGYGSAFDGVTAITFWAKGPSGLKFHFDVETIETAGEAHSTHVSYNSYGQLITISDNDWKQYTVSLTVGAASGIAQENWGAAAAFTFKKANVTKLAWKLKSAENTVNAGTLLVDDVTIVGDFGASDAPGVCNACVSSVFGAPTPSVLLSDFEGASPEKNALGDYWYEYGNTGSTVGTPVYASSGRVGGGASVSFTAAGSGDIFAGVGTNLGAAPSYLNGSSFTGVYFEYKTTGVDAIKFLIVESAGAETPNGTDFQVKLPGTGGEWKAARVGYTDLSLPDWAPARTFNKADLAKLQFGFYDAAGTGSIALDNVYFVGASAFPGGGGDPVTPGAQYKLNYIATPGGYGTIYVGGENKGGTYETPLIASGASGPTVTATPIDARYRFLKWDDNNSVVPSRTDIAAANATYTAIFEAVPSYTITYKATEGGEISVDNKIYDEHAMTLLEGRTGESVTALNKYGYVFVAWSDGQTDVTRRDAAARDAVFTAVFEVDVPPPQPVKVTYTSGDEAMGGLLVGTSSVPLPEYSADLMPEGSVTVTALPSSTAYKFVGWSDGIATTVRTDAYEKGAVNVIAIFAKADEGTEPGVTTFTLTYVAGVGGKVQADGAGPTAAVSVNVAAGATGRPVVTAVPDDGHHFVAWSDRNGQVTRTDVADADLSVTAEFAPDGINDVYTVAYAVTEGGSLRVGYGDELVPSFETTVAYGESAPVVVPIADYGYTFAGWSDGSSANPRRDQDVQADITVTATFERNPDIVAVAEHSREAPPPASGAETVLAIAPLTITAGEITAGPSPASKHSGAAVKFFRVGQAIKAGKVLVYDGAGNLVKRIGLSDKNAVTGTGKRVVGAWDLKDAQGRAVAEGTYLVRGVVTTKAGGKERVSALIAVVK